MDKKNLLKDWKNKTAIQALICYRSAQYYSIMDMVLGIPSIILSSSSVILKGYSTYYAENYQLIESILLVLNSIISTAHIYCGYSGLSEKFRQGYQRYSSIKRDIDIYQTVEFNDTELLEKILDIKKQLESIKQESNPAPWVVSRKFDETAELLEAGKLAEQIE